MFSRDQYDAAHRAAVTSDGASTGTVALTGDDRRSFLHALLTNDIAALASGSGVYAAYLTPQGRMISDMRVIETGDRILLSMERGIAASLADRLHTLVFSEDVEVKDVSDELDVAGVHGPSAGRVIEQATGISVAELDRPYRNLTSGLTIVRDDRFGVPGFDLYTRHAEGASLREQLAKAGAVSANEDTLEALRIEAGRPRFGLDMNTDTIPLEAGIEERAISFTKGCYVGQEVIVRVMHRGHGRVARRLVQLVLTGGAVPSRGDAVFGGGRQIGEVTSAAQSPKSGAPIAMAYVHRDYAAAGAEVTVNGSTARVHQAGN